MSEPVDINNSVVSSRQNEAIKNEPARTSEQFKTKPHLRPDENKDGETCDTMTQLIRPPDSVMMEAGAKKLLKISCHKCLQKLDVTFLESFSRFSCPSCNVELIVPKWFDNYLLEEPGGIGGMATVYRALDLALDREVAIKVLNPDVASNTDRAELFLHEARTAATINHYAVIPIYTCGIFEGQPYIVMQYMGGGSLEAKLKLAMGTLPVVDVAKWVRDVAEGLDNARRHGITHHDIKPGNIMLDSDGNAKIGDFGLAQAVNDDRRAQFAEMTKAWVSPHYASPEKVSEGKEDFLGDVYSLGATFYHLTTGFTPFSSTNIDELLKLRLKADPQPPHQQRSDLPVPLSHLILAMMDREPDKRPHYREVAKTLNEFLKGSDSKAKTILKAPPKTKTSSPNQDVDLDSNLELKSPAGGRKSGLLIGLVSTILALAIVGGIGFYGWTSGRLQQVFPFLSLGQATSKDEDTDKVPEATAAFASGDAMAALAAADKAFSNVSAPTDMRMQAAIQLAIANYLSKDAKAKENCAFIAERLEAIRTAADPSGELVLGDPPGKAIVNFLANYENTPSDLRERLTLAPPSMRLAGSLAIFLRAAKSKAPRELVISSFASYRSDAAEQPKNIWGNAWLGRSEQWSKALEGYLDAPEVALLEPMLASLPQQIGVKPGSKQKAPKVVVFSSATESPASVKTPEQQALSSVNQALLDKFAEPAINAFLSRLATMRPRPAGLDFDQQVLEKYLSSVSEDLKQSEAARASLVVATRSSLARTLMRIPFEFESFESGYDDFGKGKLFSNGKDLIYRGESSSRNVRLKWENLTSKQYMDIVDSYAKLLEAVAFDAAKDSTLRSESAHEILKLAVLAGWYGDCKLASQSAQRALRIDSGLGKEAESLLLK